MLSTTLDPDNRLVADTLEAEWNTKLRAVREAQEEHERQRDVDRHGMGENEKKEIIALATDIPRLWNNPKTLQQDKKRILRHLIDDVTLTKAPDRRIVVQVRFRGGATTTIEVTTPKPAPELFSTSKATIDRIDSLLNCYHDSGVAAVLNADGQRTPRGKPFRSATVGYIRRTYGLASFYDRVHKQNNYTIKEMAQKLRLSYNTVYLWVKNRILDAELHPARRLYLCKLEPDILRERLTSEYQSGRMTPQLHRKMMDRLNEVQYEL